MKFMKLGIQEDTFYTEEATRTVISDASSNLVIRINNVTYLLHKFSLIPKCGLLQKLCSGSDNSANITIELDDIPGGEDAFELCAKFCYGISINLSAHNFVPAYCAAKFLRMTESVEKGNFIVKLETFFSKCILENWKDSIIVLQTTVKLPEWSENLGIIRRCIDSVVEKIITHTAKVTWSYTYSRPGYSKKHQEPVPRDWWTEDISDLDIDLFRYIIINIKSKNTLPPQLIGEALHVYASRWLPDATKIGLPESSVSRTLEQIEKYRRIIETVVNMIPAEMGSVSVGFLLRLLSISNYLRVSPMTKTELIRRSSLQLMEATVSDLLFPSHSSSNQQIYDIDLVGAMLESYIEMWRRQTFTTGEDNNLLRSMRRVGKLIDSYLQVVARDKNMPVSKVVSLAEALPGIARTKHDDLYKAICIYLMEHPELIKAEKKRLCRVLDCQRLSSELCAHAVRNEQLPLRTVVQVLFFDNERYSRMTTHTMPPQEISSSKHQTTRSRDHLDRQLKTDCTRRSVTQTMGIGENVEEDCLMRRNSKKEGRSSWKLDPKMLLQRKSRSNHSREKGKKR